MVPLVIKLLNKAKLCMMNADKQTEEWMKVSHI